MRQLTVTIEDDLANLHLGFLVDAYIKNHLVLASDIIALRDVYLGVVIAFVVEVFLGKDLGAVNHVRSNLTAFHDTQLCLHVLLLALLQTIVVDGADTRTGSQMDAEIHLATHDGVGRDGYL